MTSDYFLGLDRTSKDRYLDKIRSINGVDPYSLTKDSKEKLKLSVLFPNIAYMDVVNYLVYGVSAYTAECFKFYKSLEAYNQFACGWVSDVSSTKINGLCLVLGKVRHSQSLSDKPVQPWVIATVDGVIESAHCTCMAGLGESCTHVGALLFYMQNLTLNREELSVTSVPAYWSQPTRKTVEYLEVHNIDFSTPHAKIESCSKSAAKPLQDVPEMSDTEFHAMLTTLHDSGCGSAILNIVPPFNCSSNVAEKLSLRSLFIDSYLSKSLQELQEIAKESFFQVTTKEAKDIELKTKAQAKSKLWYKYRAGRITASNLKAACITKLDAPSITTIKRICYPEKSLFHSKATSWGCNHEKDAKSQYAVQQSQTHGNFELSNAGLTINEKFPFLGASPDGFVSCACCGLGCIEVLQQIL
ncbi:hypothetical protein JTE90_001851 [Oedothorax gibbosus]|uniref:SWIM-type domain-containing protein n=1 Tax=Oedothorax gibbosus TaxID=931172 RepID=A0AAV6VR86_9ARAC|nr:hypothetical protein JTE90_001851 [Oedothorax gibbosus]